MIYAAHSTDLPQLLAAAQRPSGPKPTPRRGFLRGLFDAMRESRYRLVDREVQAYLARTGYRFTDSIEREINDRHFNGGWNARR